MLLLGNTIETRRMTILSLCPGVIEEGEVI